MVADLLARGLARAHRTPRAWQLAAAPVALAALLERRPGIVYAATGAGKSDLLGLVLASFQAGPGWVDVIVVPTQHLVIQTVAGLAPWGIAAVPWYQGHRTLTPADGVAVACRDSLPDLVDHLAGVGRRVRCVLVDEAHGMGPASACWAAIQRIEAELITDGQRAKGGLPRIGVTATPARSRGLDLRELWPAGILHSYTAQDAIRDGVILRPRVVVPVAEEGEATERDVDDLTVDLIRAHAVGPTVCDAATIVQACAFAARLTAEGIPAASVDATTPKAARAATIEALHAGRIRVVVHVRLLAEGVDFPWLETMVIRQKMSDVRWIQAVGRVVRTAPGKTHAVLVDVRDQWRVLGMPVFGEAEWDTEEETRERAEPLPGTRKGLGKAKAQDPVRLVRALEGWLVRLSDGLESAGLVPPRERNDYRDGTPWRIGTLRKWAADRRKSPARYLAESQRERWHALCESPDLLTGQGCADAVRVGFALLRHGSSAYRDTGRTWTGAQGVEA